MKAAAFDYVRAGSADDAVEALAADTDARILAGGQSLVPLMALRLATPEVLVDINRCADLRTVEQDGPVLRVGAAVTGSCLERDAQVRAAHPLLVRTLAFVAHPEIRARGTLCGSLAHADPAAELPALLLALGGEVEIRGGDGTRVVAARDFFAGPFTTALREGELIVAARLPLPGPRSSWAVEEISRRRGDFAIVGVVCVLDRDDEDRCSRAAIGLFGVAGTPVRARAAEEQLVGAPLTAAALDTAAAAAFDGVDVLGDEVHASAGYRRRAGTTLVRRALAAAVDTVRGGAR